MKWIFKLMLVMTLAFSGSVYAERTVQEVAAEARVSSTPVDTTDMKVFAIAQDDASVGLLNELSQDTLQRTVVKMLANWFGYNPDLAEAGGNFLNVFFDNIYATLGIALSSTLLIFFGGFLLWHGRMLKDRQAEKERARKTTQFGILVLVSGLVIIPEIGQSLFGVFILTMIACLNWTALTITLFTVGDAADNIEQEFKTTQQLTQYDTGEVIGIWNALSEKITKSSVVAVYGVQLGRDGFFSSPFTKTSVVNDIQNNVKLNIVPRYKDGTVFKLDFVYNENFENYSPEKFGRAIKAFSVKTNNLQDSYEQDTEKDVMRAVRLKAQADGESLFSAGDFHSTLQTYESNALPLVSAGKYREAQSVYDEALIMKVSMKMDEGLEEIKNKYLSAGYGEGMFRLYSIYASTFINAAQGINPSVTYAGKWKYQQEAADYLWKYNCSNLPNQDIANIKINGFNIIAAGTSWRDVNSMAAAGLPSQCVTYMGGRAYYVGVDAETDPLNVLLFKDRTTSAAIAISNLTSNITEGALTGQLKFLMKNNPYKNLALSYIDLGFVHVGISAGALGKAMNYTSRVGSSVRNGITVETAAAGEFNTGADLNMLFGEDAQKSQEKEAYKKVTTDYKPMMFDALVDPSKAASGATFQQVQNFNEAEPDVGDMIVSVIQNQSSLLLNRKLAMGLPVDKSFSEGIKDCNANASACNKRATGTISDIYSTDPLKLGIAIKIGTTAISALKSFDIGEIVQKFNIGGDTFVGKLLGKLGSAANYVGFLFKLGVFVLDVLLVPMDWFANFLIALGVWAIGLSVIPAVMMIMLVVGVGLLFIEAIIIFYSSLFQAVMKVEPRYMFTGMKLIFSSWVGVLFYLIGFEVMLFFINAIGTGKLERAIYGSVAGEGGLFAMLTGLLVSLFVIALLHTMCFKIPSMFMGFKDKIFGDSTRILDEAASERTFSSLAFAYAGEKVGVRIFDSFNNSVKGKVKGFADKLRGKEATPPAGDSKPASDTEGR